MTRFVSPEPDRWYLQSIESIQYIMAEISMALRLGTDDPAPNFRSCVRMAEHLNKIIRFAAIVEERKDNESHRRYG